MARKGIVESWTYAHALIVLASATIEGFWTNVDTEWRGIIGILLLFGFAGWAIWESPAASLSPTKTQPTNP